MSNSSESTKFKMVVVGAGGVGKSGLTLQFCAGKCPKRYDPTIEDSYRKTTEVDGRACTLDILDTAGQEEYASLRSEYMQEGKGFVLVYSITAEESFNQMDEFKKQIEQTKGSHEKVPIVLVGNKSDLESERKVMTEQGQKKAEQWRKEAHSNPSSKIGEVEFRETSAMTKVNVEETFKGLVRLMFKDKPAGGAAASPKKPAGGASGGSSGGQAPHSADKQPQEKGGGCKCVVQ